MPFVVAVLAGLLAVGSWVAPPASADAALAELLARPTLKGIEVSVAVVDVADGRMLLARSIDAPRVPASNMKLVTTAAAVGLLGADYRFTTRFVAEGAPDADGLLAGDLVVVGGGDPCLRGDILGALGIAEPAAFLADMLLEAGVRRITGALALDDGLFDDQRQHPEWPADDLDKAYAPPVDALSMHGNCLTLEVSGRGGSPQARLVTATGGYRVENELRRAATSTEFLIWPRRPDESGMVRLTGTVGAAVDQRPVQVPVLDGSRLFGLSLLAELQRRGVTVDGGLALRPGAAAALGSPVELATYSSPLSTAVLLANKESDNSIAEHLFKLVGAEVVGEGSFAGGARAVERFLGQQVGTATVALAVRDGSGLAPTNRVTARCLVDVLTAMARGPADQRDVYLRTLPVSGLDGSLAERLAEAPYAGRVRAKTGWIGGASSLSGYAYTRSGRLVAFSLLFNGVPRGRNRYMKAAQDDICRLLVDAL